MSPISEQTGTTDVVSGTLTRIYQSFQPRLIWCFCSFGSKLQNKCNKVSNDLLTFSFPSLFELYVASERCFNPEHGVMDVWNWKTLKVVSQLQVKKLSFHQKVLVS